MVFRCGVSSAHRIRRIESRKIKRALDRKYEPKWKKVIRVIRSVRSFFEDLMSCRQDLGRGIVDWFVFEHGITIILITVAATFVGLMLLAWLFGW